MGLESQENFYIQSRRRYWIPIVGGLTRMEDEHFHKYERRVSNLPSPEALLKEQQRIERQSITFQRLARFGFSLPVSSVIATVLIKPEIIKQIIQQAPIEVVVGGLLAWALLDLAAAHLWWMTDIKRDILAERNQ